MKDKTKTIIGFSLIIIGAILMLGPLFDDLLNERTEYSNKETKCYDGYRNEIVGQTCIDKSPNNPYYLFIVLGLFMTFLGAGVLASRRYYYG